MAYATKTELAEQVKKLNERIGSLVNRTNTVEATQQKILTEIAELHNPPAPIEPKPEPTPGPIPVVKPDLFYGDQISDFAEVIQAAPGRITEVPDPLSSGQKVIAMTVNDSDVAPLTPTNNPRAQLQTNRIIKPGMEFYIATEILFPSNFPSFDNWMTLLSVYGAPYGGSGSFHIASYGKTLQWEEHWEGPPLVRGRWMPLLMHGLFEYDGWGEVEIDGHPSGKINAPIRQRGVNDGADNDVRLEQYRSHGMIPGSATLYFKPLLIGTTRASVGR